MDEQSLPAINPSMIRQHLDLMFCGTEGYVPVRLLEEKGGAAFKRRLPFEMIDDGLASRVIALASVAAEQGAGTFVVPGTVLSPRRARAEDITHSTCLLVDLDAGDIAMARLHLETHLGPATAVVKSGGVTENGQPRLHLYWRLDAVASGDDLKLLSNLRGEVARKAGGDHSFASMHQPIRLAGSIHAKNGNRRLVEIIDLTDRAYTMSDLAVAVAEMPALAGSPPTIKIDTGSKRPTATDLKTRRIRSEGKDDVTRFEAVGKVIGHWLHTVRSGRITLDEAWGHVEEHNAACIQPPWDQGKLRTSFDALLKRDIEDHGPMPDLYQPIDHGGASIAGNDKHSQGGLQAAVFVSEDDLADRFVMRFRSGLRFVPARGAWMLWTGSVWEQDETRSSFDRVRMICRAAASALNDEKLGRKLCSERTINAVEKLARTDPRIAVRGSAWDRGGMIINTPSGTLDLVTLQQKPHAPKNLLTRITNASPEGGCTRWLQFLDEVTGSKPGLTAYLQRVAGYCLTGSMAEQVFFFLHGTGANGKSIFIATLLDVLGDYAATAPLDTFTASNSERHPTDLAGLATARAVFVTETEHGKPWAESRIKAITGGDSIRVRFLYRDFFEIDPTFKIIVAGNSRPRLVGAGEAMKRRLHLIPFDVTIPPDLRQKDLQEQLHRERNGIFAWMLAGCEAWQKSGLEPPPCVRDAADEYFSDEDLVRQWIDEACVTADQARARSALLYKCWAEWADARGFDRGSQRSLGEELRTRGFKSYRTGRERGWVGLCPQPIQATTDRVGAA